MSEKPIDGIAEIEFDPTQKDRGRVLYEAYHRELPHPLWEELPSNIRIRWCVSIEAHDEDAVARLP